MQLSEFRTQYPQYDNVSDVDLAEKIHGKYYSDMDFNLFAENVGLQQEEIIPPAQQETIATAGTDRQEDLSAYGLPPEQEPSALATMGGQAPEGEEEEPYPTSLAVGGANLEAPEQTTGEMLKDVADVPKAFGAAAAKATLGISESIFRTPDAVARHYDALVQSGRDLGLPEWTLPKTEDLYVPDAINLRKHSNIVADEISKSQQLMVENFDTFKALSDKGDKANKAFKAAIGGDTSQLPDILTDIEAWAGFIGNAAPTLYASIKSGGSPLFISWMEAMDVASDAADFEKETGKKIDDREFARTQLMVAGINTWLEKLGVDKITNAKGLLGIVGSAITEGTTEGLQELVQNIAKKMAWRPKIDLSEGVLPSIMGGGGTGMSASSIQQAAIAIDNYQVKSANKERMAELKKAFDTYQSDLENEVDTTDSVDEINSILTNKEVFSEVVTAFDEYEASEATQKKADEEKAFAEINKDTVVPADIEPAAPTTTGKIEQSLAAEKAEREISEKPKSAMEAAFEKAAPAKKYGLPIEEAAKEVDTKPTEAQKEAGNYKKGHTKVQGMDVAIENPKGSVRKGVDEGGQKWSQKMDAHYGYIKKTQGADGDHVDVFLGPEAETADTFYVVNQTNPTTGKFDEHKVMIGYPDEKTAKAAYMKNYAKGWQGFSSIVPLSTEQFKRFVHSPAKTKKALPDSAPILLSRGAKKTKGFTTKTTDMPYYDDLMRDPEYFKKNKGIVSDVVHMTPDEYMAKLNLKIDDDIIAFYEPELTDKYAEKMKKGEEFPMATLHYDKGKIASQEGRHRAIAAKKAGIKTMPVLIVKKVEKPKAAPKPAKEPTQTKSPIFKKWFGKSKVVDKAGEPLVVYHGTDVKIASFDKGKLGSNTGAPSAETGFFFTDREKTAKWYSRGKAPNLQRARKYGKTPNVVSAHLSLQNPLVHDFKGKVYREESYREIIDKARANGHDGVILKNTYDAGEYGKLDAWMKGRFKSENIYVVFESNQIKFAEQSATPKKTPAKKKGFVAVSPNDWDAEMSFDEAAESIRSEKHQTSHAIADDVFDEMGLEHTTHDALGDWTDGAEDSLFIEVESPESLEQLKYTASLTGKFFNQKGSLSFIADEKGPDSFYKVTIPVEKGDINAIRSTLDELKLEFRTLVPGPTGTTVVIYDEGATLTERVSKLGKKYGQEIEEYKGQGEIIGSNDSRQEGISAYNREIGVWERKHTSSYTPQRKGLRDFWGTGYQEQGAETKAASRTVAAPIPLSRLNAQPIPDVYGKFGALDAKKDTTESLKFYNLDKLVANPKLVRDMVKSFGFEVKYFSFHVDEDAGVDFVIPKLKKQGYKDGYLWIYDPRVAHGSFKDVEYTRQWRVIHELGHALTEDIMQKRYGDSRREGRLGQSWMATRGKPPKQVQVELEPLTLKEAQRAVEWEDVAFRVQRMLFESLGVTVDPVGFAREYNTNVGDAAYRVLTGDFGDPGEYGFVPRGTLPEVKSVLKMFENTENAMAKEQGRKPTKGINLNTYKRISEKELRALAKDAGKPPVLILSKGKKPPTHLSVKYIEKSAAIIQKNWAKSPEIHVVGSPSELPEYIRRGLKTKESSTEDDVHGFYMPEEGKIYIIADKIESKEALIRVVLHEIMGHHGIRGLFGNEIDPFLNEVYKANKEAIRDHAKSIDVQISPQNRLEMTEEFISITAETNPQSTIVTRTIAKIVQWLRKIMPSLRLTSSELIEIIVGMRQNIETGEVTQIAANAVQQIQDNINAVGVYSSKTNPLKKAVKRFFTKESLLDDEGFEAKVKSDSLKKAGEEDISFVIHKFDEAIKKAFSAKNYVNVSEEGLIKVNDYLLGKEVRLPTELKEVLDGMRSYIDRLSAGMQKAMDEMMLIQRYKLNEADNEGFQAFLEGDPNGYVPESMRKHYEMHQTITNNLGTYMNRSYEAFDNEKWKNKVLKNKDLVKRAEAYIAELNPDLMPEEVHGAVRAILQAAKDKGNFFSFISGGTKYGKKDVSLLTHKKDIPDVIRELLGEYTDPRINFARTTTNMYNYLANHSFLMQLRSKGLGTFMFERPIGDFDKLISAEGAETMNPIDGLYTTEEFIQGLEDMRDAIEGGAVMRSFIRLNSAVKYGKTILAPTTQARNFMSAAMFSVMNGHFNWAHGQKAFRAAQSDLFTKDEKWRKYLSNLIQLGVLHDNPRAEELRHALEDFMKIDIYSKGPTKSLRRFLNFMQRLYQVGDDFWKIIGFENEVKLQMEAGKSRKDAEKKAAYRIRNGYPTYSMVPRAVKMVRRWPLIGTFVSFPYEIVRTSANQMRFLAEDVAAGNKEMVARRTLGIAMATSISATLSYMSMVMMGLTDDDDESVRALAAPWVRNSQLVYLGYDESGYPKYIDFSYFDPYTYLKKPITAILNKNNEGIDKKVLDALTEFLEPFIGVDIAAGALMEIYSNKRAGTGTKIYNEEAPTDEIASDMINHFRKAAQPGAVSNAERMMKAIRGETSASGKEYKIEDEAVALVGFRMGTLNVPQSIYYKTLEFKDVKSSATQQLNKVVGSGTKITEKDIKRGFAGMMQARKKGFTEMIKMVNAAEKLGVKKSVINRVLKAAKVNKTDIRYILNGRIPKWRMTSSFMDAAQTRALATANKDNRTKIREDFYKRKKYVYELMSEQDVD